MDKARNVRRGATSGFSNTNNQRHKKHKHLVLTASIRGDLKTTEKSKKEKVRSLSSVSSRALSNYQMGCHISEKEEHEPSSSSVIPITKRFKIPKNLLNDCNGVHHASVPRKLRSGMKKRSQESMLLNAEKVKHKISGIESSEKDDIKKCKKQGISQEWSPRGGEVSRSTTKDEEEVAETLYALAGMFHDIGSNDSNKELEAEILPKNNANDALEASGSAQRDASPCPERSPRESSKASSLHETIGEDHLENLHSITPTVNIQTMPMIIGSENCNEVALHDCELCLGMGFNMTRQSHISHNKKKPDMEFEAASDVDNKQEQHMMKVKEQKANEDLALWPDLYPAASIDQAYLQSCAAKAPEWLKAAICASKQEFYGSCSSGGKVPEVVIHKSSWKRCAAHVHISHIIRNLEVPKRHVKEGPELYECHQKPSHEESRRRVPYLNGVRNGVIFAHETGPFAFERNPHAESNNGILQQKCHYRDTESQAAPTHGVFGPQKQSYNFVSMSTESSGLKRERVANRLQQCSKLQVPYFQSSLPQLHGFMPIPAPQSQHASTSYHDQLFVAGAQVRVQQPQYYGSPLSGTHYRSTVSNKQQQHSFWAGHLAAQESSAINSSIMRSQYPNWRSVRHDSVVVSPCAQATLPISSLASPEVLGSKIASISAQQKQLLIAPIKEKWARTSSPFCM